MQFGSLELVRADSKEELAAGGGHSVL